MPAAVVAAAFEHVDEADQVGIDIGVRIDRANTARRPAPRDGRRWETVLARTAPPSPARSARSSLTKRKRWNLRKLGEPRLLQRRIVIGVEVVEADDVAAVSQQPPRDVKADEAGGAGDEDRAVSHRLCSRVCVTEPPQVDPFRLCARSSFDLTSSTMPCAVLEQLATSAASRRAT